MPIDKSRLMQLEHARDHLAVARKFAKDGRFGMLGYLLDVAYEEADSILFNSDSTEAPTNSPKAKAGEIDIFEKLTGEIIALRIAMQVQASLLAYATEGGDEQMKMSLNFTLDQPRKSQVESGTLSTAQIFRAAEHCLRQIFSNSKIAL